MDDHPCVQALPQPRVAERTRLTMNPEAVMIIYVCNGCGALAPDSRQPTTKCACGTHDWRRFTRSK